MDYSQPQIQTLGNKGIDSSEPSEYGWIWETDMVVYAVGAVGVVAILFAIDITP